MSGGAPPDPGAIGPAAPPAGPSPSPPSRTFRRTAGTRALAILCCLFFAAGAGGTADPAGPAFYLLAALALIGAVNVVAAWGDRITIDDAGIERRNVILERLGGKPRRVAWDEVVALREHHRLRAGAPEAEPSALFLTLRSGRRLVLDSLGDFDALRRAVRARCGRAG